MAIQKQSYQIVGMRQDNLVGTATSSKFAHEIINMRLNTIGDYTTASWTTEKGTKKVIVNPMTYTENGDSKSYYWPNDSYLNSFKPIGQAVINDNWIIFGIAGDDSVILHITNEYDSNKVEHWYGRMLYHGNLGFDVNHPIETIVFYENEEIQKVYWTDGVNQPRMINIKGAYGKFYGFDSNNTTQFDFVQEVSLKEEVYIHKEQSGTGLFPPCTVKYAITYYHKYGQETNIIYDSPLFYPTKGDRACAPEELSGDSFVIRVDNIDTDHGFDYIRLYSIIRTSDNATPIVRIVDDKEIKSLPVENDKKYALFVDTNTTGEIVDPSILQYIGGNEIAVDTFTSKDNVLFLGDITLKQKSVEKELTVKSGDYTINYVNLLNKDVNFFNSEPKKRIRISDQNNTKALQYYNQLNQGSSHLIKTFKKGETYRFGIQFQDSLGKWSEVIKLNDAYVGVGPYDNNDSTYNLAYAKYTIGANINNEIKNHYSRARLVCCYPTNADRSVIMQGVVNPTVYNVRERNEGTIYGMASWFFRPFGGEDPNLDNTAYRNKYLDNQDDTEESHVYDNDLRLIPWSGRLPNSGRHNAEIQSLSIRNAGIGSQGQLDKDGTWPFAVETNDTKDEGSHYIVDDNLLTLNSPELDFDESIYTLPNEGFNIKIIGHIPINKYVSKYYIDADGVGIAIEDDSGSGKGEGLIDKSRIRINTGAPFGTHDIMAGYWDDIDVYENNTWKTCFPLYPFQRQGSLNNYMGDYDGTTQSAKLNSKVFATLMYSDKIEYNDRERQLSFGHIDLYNDTENVPLVISDTDIYYGNMNGIVPLSKESDIHIYKNEQASEIWGNYKIYNYLPLKDSEEYKYNLPIGDLTPYGYRTWHATVGTRNGDGIGGVSSNPVPLTYKSTPHYIFKLSQNERLYPNYDPNITPSTMPYLNLVEVTRDVVNNRFGGEDNPSNIYYPCGPSVDLRQSGNITLYGLEGDHYFMRYDCLKTYPYTTEDVNQIVEILSFMCESRTNLDGRYDKNRCLSDNTYINNTNFNLINKSYTQTNNIFSFTTLEELDAKLDKFSNQISWTRAKVSGEDIDAWTNITLASTADADGTLGSINRLVNINDKILLFQDHGICYVNYNENTAISTESGLPLELAKTGKFTGLSYITKDIGCQNKWSISVTKNGVLWIDDSRQELLRFGDGIKSLSTENGFDAFMIRELPKMFTTWNPESFYNFVTYYDKLSNDVYYINANKCLAWNEQSATFTSFYNYEHVPYMMNIGQYSLMWNNGIWAAREADGYSTFFDNAKDYSMTLVCDGVTDKGFAFSADKVFNNIEFRAEVFNINGLFNNFEHAGPYNDPVFNIKHVWNGYQDSQEVALDGERKFNTWRVQLPRHHGTRDRIRNPFCYIKLKQDQSEKLQTDRVILHDLAVYFDIR